MNAHQNIIKINVDTHNPGQFFACCGLFELAHRLWKGTEGWFEENNGQTTFCLQNLGAEIYADLLLNELRTCSIEGLNKDEREERKTLEKKRSDLKKQELTLSEVDANRLAELGTAARSGSLYVGIPFTLRLDWWENDNEDSGNSVKTWAAKQETHKIARSLQDALLKTEEFRILLSCSRKLKPSIEYKKDKDNEGKSFTAFYFDARTFVHPRDVGYSLDVQKLKAAIFPAVELLALVGVQRFHPKSSQKWHFTYATWTSPMPIAVAAAIACGMTPSPSSCIHEFRLNFRDDQRRYKAFSYSTLYKGK